MVGISALYGDEQIQELVLEKYDEFSMQFIVTVKQNCIWKIVVRSVHHVWLPGMNNSLRGGKGGILFAYDAAVAFQTKFCFTILQICLASIPILQSVWGKYHSYIQGYNWPT